MDRFCPSVVCAATLALIALLLALNACGLVGSFVLPQLEMENSGKRQPVAAWTEV